MGVGDDGKARARREYRPSLEGLEAVRLLSAGQTQAFSHVSPSLESNSAGGDGAEPSAHRVRESLAKAAWDAALVESSVSDLLAEQPAAVSKSEPTIQAPSDPASVSTGLAQLGKYLNRAWYRAGIPTQYHDDSSQAVYETLLRTMGRPRFESLVSTVGVSRVKDVFNRDTSQGVAFFRAVDMVKKRAQRERIHTSLDAVNASADLARQEHSSSLREALREAIAHNLSAREAALIQDTLAGKTPAEIASSWGVTPKTVSNEKSRVLQKLRDALVDHELN